MKTLQEQLTAAKRELALALRKNAYPKWLIQGKPGWTADKVRHEIECMESIQATLERSILLEEASNDLFQRPTQQVPIAKEARG